MGMQWGCSVPSQQQPRQIIADLGRLALYITVFCCAFYVKVDSKPFIQRRRQPQLWGFQEGEDVVMEAVDRNME